MDDTTLQRYNAYRNDPWLFLTECVFTRDAVDADNPVKLFPNYDYIKFLVRAWQRKKKIAIPKSRRMTASWTFISLALWDVIFHRGREWAFVSKKEDDSMELVARAEFIYNKIPPDKIPKVLLPTIKGGRMLKSPPKLEFDFGNNEISYIAGFPMGADQLRQFTFSGLLGDECAFWPNAEEFYTGAKPTTDGGGRMILISSRSPCFFKKLVFDKINFKGNNFPEVPPAPVKVPMQGVEIWENPNNEFLIIDLHYTAHPDKRDPNFQQALKNSLPLHQYLREYERNWQTFAGMPVFPNFRRDIHIAKTKLSPHLGLPLLFGWDFGLTGACIVGQLQGNSLKVFKEWVTKNEGVQTFAPKVMNEVKLMFPEWNNPHKDHFHFVDPAGFQRAQTDLRTCVQEMSESAPIYNIEPGPINFTQRKGAVEHFLLYIDKDGAGLEINQEDAPTLVEGFAGGYRYADSQSDVESKKPEPIKDAYSHPHDAFQYLCYGATQHTNTSLNNINIPTPTYSFIKHTEPQHRKEELSYVTDKKLYRF